MLIVEHTCPSQKHPQMFLSAGAFAVYSSFVVIYEKGDQK